MRVFIKCVLAACYVISAFIAPALLVVGTGALFESLMGDYWYVGLLAAPLILVEFAGGIVWYIWSVPRVGDWAIGVKQHGQE